MRKVTFGLFVFLACAFRITFAGDIWNSVSHGYIENQGVKLHYATLGEGPLVVMLHGYPDFWYTWREQMKALSGQYQAVAVDLRGYNRSDRPEGVENYRMSYLISDVVAVIQHFPQKKAILIGHDWGGAIAWQTAIYHPELVDRLIVLSTPHPRGLVRELTSNPKQQKSSKYAQDYQRENAHQNLTPESLANWVHDEDARKHYLEAFQRSDFEAMLNYYKASFPKSNSNAQPPSRSGQRTLPNIQCPVLALFGLQDKALLASGWNGTWDWIDKDLTLVSIPHAGHFVQQDASDFVTHTIQNWLDR